MAGKTASEKWFTVLYYTSGVICSVFSFIVFIYNAHIELLLKFILMGTWNNLVVRHIGLPRIGGFLR
jgi:hypothetical protein